MYVSPNHPSPPKPYAPPEDRGQRLATLRRMHGEELRVSIDEYEGHKYVSLRVWAPVMGGPMGPVKNKGLSVRVRELADVADALRQAADILDGVQPGSPPVSGSSPGRPEQPDPGRRPGLSGGGDYGRRVGTETRADGPDSGSRPAPGIPFDEFA